LKTNLILKRTKSTRITFTGALNIISINLALQLSIHTGCYLKLYQGLRLGQLKSV